MTNVSPTGEPAAPDHVGLALRAIAAGVLAGVGATALALFVVRGLQAQAPVFGEMALIRRVPRSARTALDPDQNFQVLHHHPRAQALARQYGVQAYPTLEAMLHAGRVQAPRSAPPTRPTRRWWRLAPEQVCMLY